MEESIKFFIDFLWFSPYLLYFSYACFGASLVLHCVFDYVFYRRLLISEKGGEV